MSPSPALSCATSTVPTPPCPLHCAHFHSGSGSNKCVSHTLMEPAPDRTRTNDALALGDDPFAAKRHPQRVLGRVHGCSRRDRVCMRPVELVEGDAVERDADIVRRLLELTCGLFQVNRTGLVVGRCCHLPILHGRGRELAPVGPSTRLPV